MLLRGPRKALELLNWLLLASDSCDPYTLQYISHFQTECLQTDRLRGGSSRKWFGLDEYITSLIVRCNQIGTMVKSLYSQEFLYLAYRFTMMARANLVVQQRASSAIAIDEIIRFLSLFVDVDSLWKADHKLFEAFDKVLPWVPRDVNKSGRFYHLLDKCNQFKRQVLSAVLDIKKLRPSFSFKDLKLFQKEYKELFLFHEVQRICNLLGGFRLYG